MKNHLFVVCAISLVLLSLTSAYNSNLSGLNIPVLMNNTVVHIFINQCLLGSMVCGEGWTEFREEAKEIYKTRCSKCTHKEKFAVKVYTDSTRKKFPETWGAIVDMLKS